MDVESYLPSTEKDPILPEKMRIRASYRAQQQLLLSTTTVEHNNNNNNKNGDNQQYQQEEKQEHILLSPPWSPLQCMLVYAVVSLTLGTGGCIALLYSNQTHLDQVKE